MMALSDGSAGVPPRSYAADAMSSRKRKRPASTVSAFGLRHTSNRADRRAATSSSTSPPLSQSGPRGSAAAGLTVPLPADSSASAGKLQPLTPTVASDGLPWPAGQDPAERWGDAGERRKLHTHSFDDLHAAAATAPAAAAAMEIYEPHLDGMPAAVLAAIASRLTTRDLLAMVRVSRTFRAVLLAHPGVWADISVPHTAASLLSDADLSILLRRAAGMPHSLDLRGCAELNGCALAGLVSPNSASPAYPVPPLSPRRSQPSDSSRYCFDRPACRHEWA